MDHRHCRISKFPSIADTDGRMGEDMFFRGVRYFASASVRRQLEAEIRAQFLAFARTGLPSITSTRHKHFHLHPDDPRHFDSHGARVRCARHARTG